MLGRILIQALNHLIEPIIDPILEWRHRNLPQDLIWESRPLGSHETLTLGDPQDPIRFAKRRPRRITLNREPKTPDRLIYHDLDRLILHLQQLQKERDK